MAALPRPSGVLLDLDGTLVDSTHDLAEATNLLLRELGLNPLRVEVACSFVGRGARALVRRALDEVDPEQTVARDDPRLRGFLGYYERVLLNSTLPYPGVEAGLARLRRSRIALSVVSNKPLAPCLTVLRGLRLDGWFDAILGGDSAESKKPSPAPLLLAASRLGLPPRSCVMVGDSDVDIEAARAAGMPGIWCSWGGFHPDRPDSAEWTVGSFEELVELLLD